MKLIYENVNNTPKVFLDEQELKQFFNLTLSLREKSKEKLDELNKLIKRERQEFDNNKTEQINFLNKKFDEQFSVLETQYSDNLSKHINEYNQAQKKYDNKNFIYKLFVSRYYPQYDHVEPDKNNYILINGKIENRYSDCCLPDLSNDDRDRINYKTYINKFASEIDLLNQIIDTDEDIRLFYTPLDKDFYEYVIKFK